jgi:hypothetical protein
VIEQPPHHPHGSESRGKGIAQQIMDAGIEECRNPWYAKKAKEILVPHQSSHNSYGQFLKEISETVICIDGVDWFEYSGFMMPAYLPHCRPEIIADMAHTVVRLSGRPFARWDAEFGRQIPGDWWYVLKRGKWSIDSIPDKKKRWRIRQGQKNFTVRPLTMEEALRICPSVAQKAAARYTGDFEAETPVTLEKRIGAAKKVPGVLEYVGCFHEDTLVSFSENHIQDNAVFLANIRHDPAFLNKYSSCGLINGILEYYLNEKQFDYVLDGCRSIYHETQFQDHLINIFGFTKEYALLQVAYSGVFGTAVALAYPFRSIVKAIANKTSHAFIGKIHGILTQEYIQRRCATQINTQSILEPIV